MLFTSFIFSFITAMSSLNVSLFFLSSAAFVSKSKRKYPTTIIATKNKLKILENNIDLVIKPIDPIGFKSIVFGSQDLKLLRFCPCPLWLIKSTEQIGEKQIVVAIDYEPDNHENELLNIQLLKIGVSLALSQFAELHIVHAWKLEHENFYRSHRINYTHEEVDKMVEEKQSERRD